MSVMPDARPTVVPEDDATGAPLPYNKLCNLGDFAHPDLVPYLHTVCPDMASDSPGWPQRSPEVERKMWEIAMALRAFADFGLLNGRSQILGVGAGREPTIFELTNHVGRVFATDLYADGGSWVLDANSSMLLDPTPHAGGRLFNPRRLVVQHMNALDLRYEDSSFDGIFSSSSIEHFGTLDDVHTAAREMHRVLKPGGILSVSTEFRLDGPPPGIPGALLMSADELQYALICDDLDWALVSPPDLSISEATISYAHDFDELMRLQSAGERLPAHLALWKGERAWTSVHLVLQKPHAPRS
jgi:SAM-dependent methyltransferase